MLHTDEKKNETVCRECLTSPVRLNIIIILIPDGEDNTFSVFVLI